ncbi:hypothetical protein BVRB_6g154450 [Beta vulgaris subsp. vulgaris]|nr:hypothetical protein BVRB_6g154450 [Beta vulgaris subsp. vulgaris]
MGNTMKSALLLVLFVIAIGLPESAMGCTSSYDCRETGCPCINGQCTCPFSSEDISSKAPPAPSQPTSHRKVQDPCLP